MKPGRMTPSSNGTGTALSNLSSSRQGSDGTSTRLLKPHP
ncbi:hypothetical protein HMPREF3039_00665 [Akkermansia sp. KLE1798]|nr:hypothetical protein HMPREF3039_00665 [Akkermansia sp. KLE1798]